MAMDGEERGDDNIGRFGKPIDTITSKFRLQALRGISQSGELPRLPSPRDLRNH
jgi:hypothetical protein